VTPGPPTRAAAAPVVRVLRAAVLAYQALRGGRPSPCRFWPSCSDYALEALEVHGASRGTWLVARRLGRCRPFGGHGVDPVPRRRRALVGRSGGRGPGTPVGVLVGGGL